MLSRCCLYKYPPVMGGSCPSGHIHRKRMLNELVTMTFCVHSFFLQNRYGMAFPLEQLREYVSRL